MFNSADNKVTRPIESNPARARLALLIGLHIAVCCVSLVVVARYDYLLGTSPGGAFTFYPPALHIFFDPSRLPIVIAAIAAFGLVASLFVKARFSFGYFAGFYFYTMVLGFVWLNFFSDLNYDHRLAGLSAVTSIVAFLLPALFISSPLRHEIKLSTQAFDRILLFILLLGIGTIVVGAIYNFRIVALKDMYQFRDKMSAPVIVNYAVTFFSDALLPFAFAGFIARKAYWRAGAVLCLLPLFYPIVLNKIAFFTPMWLLVVLFLSRVFEARVAAVLSLFVPLLGGLMLLASLNTAAAPVFYIINFRQFAIPSLAMDVYNDFFSRHDLTLFCQVSVLKAITSCPYREQLSIVMERAYGMGNYNASLFATEGIASIGPFFAPLAGLACGFIVAIGNRLSAGLPASFILTSGAILPQIMLNVPLSTMLLTHGMAITFLLWYLTPRTIFDREARTGAAV
ncbi:hypothetical protein ACFFWD_22380 [Bradyrhizobium erythrophlei]|uniref:hypothetical protein n=1 Tax=Bradyrhizobium erythrophlei TaxID=1437360 RepID=UPI0035E8DC0B